MIHSFKMNSVLGIGALLGATLALMPSAFAQRGYRQADLVSDMSGQAKFTDSDAVNPWGIIIDGDSVVVAQNGTGRISIYQLGNYSEAQVINIPPAGGATPTGIVLNDSGADFIITNGAFTSFARYLVATENGTIAGWSSEVDVDNAIEVVDNSASDAVYKGLALGINAGGRILLATDFHNDKVDVFDTHFNPLFSFTDDTLPPGFAPFGIAVIDDIVYVSFALQDAAGEDDVPGEGNGYVVTFDIDGNRLRPFISQGPLNSPWAIVRAPDAFGGFSNTILVGNFGDGKINGFDNEDGSFLGRLKNKRKQHITVEGLWGIAVVDHDRDVDTLLFTSGPLAEAHGLIGRLKAREVE